MGKEHKLRQLVTAWRAEKVRLSKQRSVSANAYGECADDLEQELNSAPVAEVVHYQFPMHTRVACTPSGKPVFELMATERERVTCPRCREEIEKLLTPWRWAEDD